MTKKRDVLVASVCIAALVSLSLYALVTADRAHASTLATLSGQLDVGSTGQDVRTLQTLLGSNPLVYPQDLVTGYYGPLTKTAVVQFQIAYGLPPVGRVGPQTLALVNQLIENDTPIDVSAPTVSSVAVSTTETTATITWTTDETASGSVHYDLVPIQFRETSMAHEEPWTSGTLVAETVSGTSHRVVITGLSPSHTYYVSTESRDLTGNITVTLSQPFTTKP